MRKHRATPTHGAKWRPFESHDLTPRLWIPAFAGMTGLGRGAFGGGGHKGRPYAWGVGARGMMGNHRRYYG